MLAIMRLGDHNPYSMSIPALCSLLRTLRQEGGMTRDSWIEAMGGIREWRKAKEAEELERFERLTAQGGRAGLGGYRARGTIGQVKRRLESSDGPREGRRRW